MQKLNLNLAKMKSKLNSIYKGKYLYSNFPISFNGTVEKIKAVIVYGKGMISFALENGETTIAVYYNSSYGKKILNNEYSFILDKKFDFKRKNPIEFELL